MGAAAGVGEVLRRKAAEVLGRGGQGLAVRPKLSVGGLVYLEPAENLAVALAAGGAVIFPVLPKVPLLDPVYAPALRANRAAAAHVVEGALQALIRS